MTIKPKQLLSDQKEREQIANNLDTCIFVEAGAGSGKTKSMVDRMAALISTGKAKIDGIVAVTFTRKAAAELRERFQIKLELIASDKSASEQARANAHEALSNLERCSISTVHSFCAKLLRERPVEAGIDPGFVEIEDMDDEVFSEESWIEYIEKAGFEGNPLYAFLAENGLNTNDIKNTYLALIKYPDIEAFVKDIPAPDFSNAKNEVKRAVLNLFSCLPKQAPEGGWDSLQWIIRNANELIGENYLNQDRLFVEILKVLEKEIEKVTQNRWGKGNWEKPLEDYHNLQTNTIVPTLKTWREYLHKPLIEFAKNGATHYESWRKVRSILNFQDLLMTTAALLRNNSEVRKYFKNRIPYLLVDEFQDTDPIQAEIVMLLTANDDKVNDWRKTTPKPGSLFLVGDPKQSIYRFRRADIDIYNEVKNIFKSGAGEVLELNTNFRSLKPIEEITNDVFINLLSKSDSDPRQAKFAELKTVRQSTGKTTSGIFKHEIDKVSRHTGELIAENDATFIANYINWAISGGLKLERNNEEDSADAKPGDFMIITKERKRLSIYAHALEELNIPYELSGGKSFNESEELIELVKVLNAVSDPNNSILLIAALRGLYFGVSDEDLYLHAKNSGTFNFTEKVPNGSPDIIVKAYERLNEYYKFSKTYTPITAIEMIIEKLGAIPLSASSNEMGSTKAGNIIKTIELLRGKKPDNTGSFPELIEFIRSIIEDETQDVEEMGLSPGTAKAVRIMNLHKAKGLESPVVFLADPVRGKARNIEPDYHVERNKNVSLGFFCVSKPKGEYQSELLAIPPDWDSKMSKEIEYLKAEEIRLDYVATTRAKDMLVVSIYENGCDEERLNWKSLYGFINDKKIEELKIDKTLPPKTREELSFSEKDIAQTKKQIQANVDNISKNSYSITSVTGLVEDKVTVFGDDGKGMGWGRIVHRSLEACGRGKRDKLARLASNWLIEEGFPSSELDNLIPLVDGIMKSDMWNRLQSSKEKYFEVPLSIMDGTTIISGVIDLIFKEADGWVLVDYKTGDFESQPERKAGYLKQIDKYAEIWQKMTNEPVKETKLCKV